MRFEFDPSELKDVVKDLKNTPKHLKKVPVLYPVYTIILVYIKLHLLVIGMCFTALGVIFAYTTSGLFAVGNFFKRLLNIMMTKM